MISKKIYLFLALEPPAPNFFAAMLLLLLSNWIVIIKEMNNENWLIHYFLLPSVYKLEREYIHDVSVRFSSD